MRNLKIISLYLVALLSSVVITSNTSSSSLSLNDAFATFATIENNNDISDSIRKSCPTYQGNNNNNIKGLVTDILKACLPQGNQPPTTPDPNQGTFTRNMFTIEGDFDPQSDEDRAKVVITDTTNDLSITYNLDGDPVVDTFVVPVGANYQVVVTTTSETPGIYTVTFTSTDCQQTNPNISTCNGTMGTTEQDVNVDIESRQQP
ncbi:MAG: hypothetical protein P0116_11290 [Candidatus Nitrosocosmicus sp.]|nr:hypothetical protein [Candidatus Nitrosocosmicus sp.]